MRLVALAFAAATFIGASCPNPGPMPPDVVTDASDDTMPSPPPLPPPLIVDAAPIDAIPPFIDATPPAPPKPSCDTACASMRKNGCKEGSISNCATKLCTINADPRFKHYDVACLTAATTPAAIANCGAGCTQ